MNENHFLLQMSNFQKKIFFGRKFQPKKILRKKIENFWLLKNDPPGRFLISLFSLSRPLTRTTHPSLTQPSVSATNAPSLLNRSQSVDDFVAAVNCNLPTRIPIFPWRKTHIYPNAYVFGRRTHNLAFLIRTCKVNFFAGHRTLSDGKIFWLTLQALVKF